MAQASQTANGDEAITVPRALRRKTVSRRSWLLAHPAARRPPPQRHRGDLAELRRHMVVWIPARAAGAQRSHAVAAGLLSRQASPESNAALAGRHSGWLVGEPLLGRSATCSCAAGRHQILGLTAFTHPLPSPGEERPGHTLLALIEARGAGLGSRRGRPTAARGAGRDPAVPQASRGSRGFLASALQPCQPVVRRAMLGMLLSTASEVEISQRDLQHLLYAA